MKYTIGIYCLLESAASIFLALNQDMPKPKQNHHIF